jgi:hypothetical protein
VFSVELNGSYEEVGTGELAFVVQDLDVGEPGVVMT